MNEVNEKRSDRTPRWQQILGLVLLLSVAVAFLLHGFMGRSFELYPHFGGGVFVHPWQQIAVGILMLGFMACLLASGLMRKRRQESKKRTAEQTDALDEP
jgi:hypothetical protein